MHTPYGKVLTPSILNSGETYRWDFRIGAIIVIVGRFTCKQILCAGTRLPAASGFLMAITSVPGNSS